jgi:hypothetical protein
VTNSLQTLSVRAPSAYSASEIVRGSWAFEELDLMRNVLSFLALLLVSLLTAVGMMLAAPSVALG